MRGTEIVRMLPEQGVAERDAMLLALVQSGDVVYDLVEVLLGGRLRVRLLRDALRFGDERDCVRLGMSAAAEAEAMAMLGLVPATVLLTDEHMKLARAAGGMLGPFTRGALGIHSDTESMGTAAMVKHSRKIDECLPARPPEAVSSWKYRVICKRVFEERGRTHAAHYGWGIPAGNWGKPAETVPDLKVVQDLERAHSAIKFADYSEFPFGASDASELDNQPISLISAITGKLGDAVAHLVSHEGPLPHVWPLYAAKARLSCRVTGRPAPVGNESGVAAKGPHGGGGGQEQAKSGGPVVPAGPATPPTPSKCGNPAEVVKPWQRWLNDHGADPPLAVDGDHGPLTEAATTAYWERRGFEPVEDEPIPDTMPGQGLEECTGLDISKHQPPDRFDWARIAQDHRFVIARACYGRKPDATFTEHVANAREAGLVVGGYIFFRQHQRLAEQVAAFTEQLDAAGIGPGDLVPAIDLEHNSSGYDGEVEPRLHNTTGRALVEHFSQKYGGALVYLAPGHWVVMGKPRWVTEHYIWTAHWYVNKPNWPDDWALWQASAKHTHPGANVPALDLNRARYLPRCV